MYRQMGRMKEMIKVDEGRMYRSRIDLSTGGALREPNALGLAPAGSRGSALSKLPKSHFGIACLYQKDFWRSGGYGYGKL